MRRFNWSLLSFSIRWLFIATAFAAVLLAWSASHSALHLRHRRELHEVRKQTEAMCKSEFERERLRTSAQIEHLQKQIKRLKTEGKLSQEHR